MRLYPVFADIAGLPVLVVGGGKVARRKAKSLLDAGARVSVGAAAFGTAWASWIDAGSIHVLHGAFDPAWLDGKWLVIAATGDTPAYFQLYTPMNHELAASLVRRAENAGYKAIVVTLDTWVTGWRPRDLNNANFPQLRGHVLQNYFTDPVFRALLGADPASDLRAAVLLWVSLFGKVLTWNDLDWLRSLTRLPIVLKGICHPDDARRAVDAGIDAIYCSNHGGRQANGGIAAIDLLPAVVDAAGATPVLFDSGVRSGSDVVKALALGATAVGIGRPYAYGLALGGAEAAAHVLRSILAEADLMMAVNGYPTIADVRSAGASRR